MEYMADLMQVHHAAQQFIPVRIRHIRNAYPIRAHVLPSALVTACSLLPKGVFDC